MELRRDFGASEEAPDNRSLSYNILQAAGARIFKTDYVACPSVAAPCFNLQTTTPESKRRPCILKGVKSQSWLHRKRAREMADADFGYVGGAPAR